VQAGRSVGRRRRLEAATNRAADEPLARRRRHGHEDELDGRWQQRARLSGSAAAANAASSPLDMAQRVVSPATPLPSAAAGRVGVGLLQTLPSASLGATSKVNQK